MSRNNFPSVVLSSVCVCCFVFVLVSASAQQDTQPPSSRTKKQENTDKRSDSQKSYIQPRSRDTQRNTGGANNTVKTPDHVSKTKTSSETKPVIRK